MNKRKIGITLFIISMLFHLFSSEEASAADKLEKIDIHVMINEDGSARITEQRVVNLNEGTENFIIIENLSKSLIKDFVVKEDGEVYQYINNWDINASRSEKAFKNGIVETKDGYELSWGIGEYGKHEYMLEYTITNFIKQLQDSQVLFWRFVNDQTNIPPEEVTVVIETDTALSKSTENIWAFGFDGRIRFDDGKIMAISDQPLDKDNYVTILVEFADGMFVSGDFIDQPFEEIRDQAFEGSDYGKEEVAGGNISYKRIALIIFAFIALAFISNRNSASRLTKKRPKKFRKKYQGEYYRDYPYEDNMLDIYYLLYVMGASNFEKLLTSFVLKWVKEERITVETERVGIIHKRDEAAIYFFNKDMEVSSFEGKLFHMMLGAAGSNDILESNEFSTWARKNHKKLMTWEKNMIKTSTKKLQDLGYIHLQKKGKFLIKTEDYELTAKGAELEKDIHKYANYLRDFSLLNEHEAVNVKIWDDIMIWAALLGLTDVVQKQFKKIYPNYAKETVYSGSSIYYASAFSSSTASARTPSSSSSGGGGYSSGGGGGGSFGGGSGGGTR